jgi:hypothetical protein
LQIALSSPMLHAIRKRNEGTGLSPGNLSGGCFGSHVRRIIQGRWLPSKRLRLFPRRRRRCLSRASEAKATVARGALKALHAPERLQTIEMGQVKKRIDIQVQRNSHVIHNCNSPHHPLASRSRNELHHGRHYPCLAGDCAGVGVGQLHFRTQIASREMAISNTKI